MAGRADFEAAGLFEGLPDEAARAGRVELLEELVRQGFSLEELKRAAETGRLALLPVDRVFDHGVPTLTPTDIAEQTGLPLELLTRLWRALGLAEVDDHAVAYTERDLEAAKTVGQFHAAGLSDEPLILISQVIGHSMSGLSETLREVVGEALLEAGDTERTLGLRYAQAADYMVPLLTPVLGYVLTAHLKEQIKQDVMYQEELVTGRMQGARPITVCFVDLVGFTALGERVPTAELGSAARQLTEMAVEAARPPVRLVKMIGDAAMLVGPNAEGVVRAALNLLGSASAERETMQGVRIGVATGEAVAHSGDWFGAPVNLASRVTRMARPMSVLTTKEVYDAAPESFAWSYAGRQQFRGVKGDVQLYRARARKPA